MGTADDQQMAQLQILYKARGSKIEDLVNEMDLLKQGMGREIRILKHHLSMAKGKFFMVKSTIHTVFHFACRHMLAKFVQATWINIRKVQLGPDIPPEKLGRSDSQIRRSYSTKLWHFLSV